MSDDTEVLRMRLTRWRAHLSENEAGLRDLLQDAADALGEDSQWEYARQYSDFDGSLMTPKPISEAEATAHKPDGHNAYGEPYWNHRIVRRRAPGPWELVAPPAYAPAPRGPRGEDLRGPEGVGNE